eukprot:1425044-Amphidinium_carterae.1
MPVHASDLSLGPRIVCDDKCKTAWQASLDFISILPDTSTCTFGRHVALEKGLAVGRTCVMDLEDAC